MRIDCILLGGSLSLLTSLGACADNLTPSPLDASPRPACVGNRDGQLTADEVPLALGQAAALIVNRQTRPWDLVGTTEPTGQRWVLDAELPDEETILATAEPLGTQWYADQFPDGVFALSDGDLDSIYSQDDQALRLHGTASREASSTQSLVVYTTPLAVLQFPLAVGNHRSQTEELRATLLGLPFVGTDTLTTEVVARGRLLLPYVTFDGALQVRSTFVRTEAITQTSVTLRSTSFLFECAGEVAHADAPVNEANPAFTIAAQMKRFAL